MPTLLKHKKIIISLLLISTVLLSISGIFYPKTTYAFPAEITTQGPDWQIKNIKEVILKKLQDIGYGMYRNAMNAFLGRAAYDLATAIATGGTGQQPLMFTETPGAYVRDLADAAAGAAIETFATDLGFDAAAICHPTNPEFKIKLGLDLEGLFGGESYYKPVCTFSEFQDNWNDFFQDPEFDKFVSAQWDPKVNPLGQALSAIDYVQAQYDDATKQAELERLVSGSFKDLKDLGGHITSPGSLIEKQWGITQETSFEGLKSLGSPLADAANIFSNTLFTKLSKRVQQGLVSITSLNLSSLIAGSSGGTTSGIKAAQATYTSFNQPNFVTTGSYDVLADLAICPEASASTSENCVIGSTMQTAIENKWTVNEFVDYLSEVQGNSEFRFSQDNIGSPEEGITYRGILVLKKYRIVPVGWQLAAEFIRSEKTTQEPTLKQLMDCYDACGAEGSQGECQYILENTTYSPFCKLVDPSWVLKAPEYYCEREAPGSSIVYDEFYDTDGMSQTQETRTIGRAQECVDERGCIQEQVENICTAYGYCSAEKRIYRSDGDVCDAAYASCQSFEVKEEGDVLEGQTVSYLKYDLNYGDCATDPGCKWYCLAQDAGGSYICKDQDTVYNVCDNSDSTYYTAESCTCETQESCWVNAGSGSEDDRYRTCSLGYCAEDSTINLKSDCDAISGTWVGSGATCNLGDNCGETSPYYSHTNEQCYCSVQNSCDIYVDTDGDGYTSGSTSSCIYTYDSGEAINCSLSADCSADNETYSSQGYCKAYDAGDNTCIVQSGAGSCINDLGNTCTFGYCVNDDGGYESDGMLDCADDGFTWLTTACTSDIADVPDASGINKYCTCNLGDADICEVSEGGYSCTTDSGTKQILGTEEEADIVPDAPDLVYNVSINLDHNAAECDSENAGCNLYYRVLSDTNLLYNATFQTIYTAGGDEVDDEFDNQDRFGFYAITGQGCLIDDATAGGCIGWQQHGVSAYAISGNGDTYNHPDIINTYGQSIILPADTTGTGYISNTIDTGYELADRTFIFAYSGASDSSATPKFAVGSADGSYSITIPTSISSDETADYDYYNEDGSIISYSTTYQDYYYTFTFPNSVTDTAITVYIYASTEADVSIDVAQLTEASSWNGSYAGYGENNATYLYGQNVECEAEDIGCKLYTPLDQDDATAIPAQITNPYSTVCGSGSDFSNINCNQCNNIDTELGQEDYYVGCDFYQEMPLTNNFPVASDPTSWTLSDVTERLAVAQRTGYYCADTTISCFPGDPDGYCASPLDCVNNVSLIPDTGLSCSASAVGCEEYTNLDTVSSGGEGLEYYSFIKQCVKDTDDNAYTFHTWEGSDTDGYAMVLYNLKASNIEEDGSVCTDGICPPCTHLDPEVEDPNAECLDSTDPTSLYYVEDCTAVYGTDPDCVKLYDDELNTYYRYASQTVTVSADCLALRNTLDQRVYYSMLDESTTCSAADAGCREYQGSDSGAVEQIVNEVYDENSTDNWTGAISTSNESLFTDDYSLRLDSGTPDDDPSLDATTANTITYNLYTTTTGSDGETVYYSDVDAGATYIATFWAKGDGALNISLNGASLSDTYYFTETGSELGSATSTDRDIAISDSWTYYILGPINLPAGEDTDDAALVLNYTGSTSSSAGYIDNVVIEKNSSQYLVKGSFDSCYDYEGCRRYRDNDRDTNYLKSFKRLCEDSAVNCEAMFNTSNSTNEFTEIFLTTNEYSTDDVVVPYDQIQPVIYNSDETCSSTNKGCTAVALPDINEQTGLISSLDTVYRVLDPDKYSVSLCEDPHLQCKEYYSDYDGTVYFKDPGDRTCDYKTYTNSDGASVYGWFIKDSEATSPNCPKMYEYDDPSQPMGSVCNSNSLTKTGDKCNNDYDCYPDGWYSGMPTPRCISRVEDDIDQDAANGYSLDRNKNFGWVGTCDEQNSGCSEYIDPNSPNIEEAIRNSGFENNVKNNVTGIYYTGGGTEEDLPDYWTPVDNGEPDEETTITTSTITPTSYTVSALSSVIERTISASSPSTGTPRSGGELPGRGEIVGPSSTSTDYDIVFVIDNSAGLEFYDNDLDDGDGSYSDFMDEDDVGCLPQGYGATCESYSDMETYIQNLADTVTGFSSELDSNGLTYKMAVVKASNPSDDWRPEVVQDMTSSVSDVVNTITDLGNNVSGHEEHIYEALNYSRGTYVESGYRFSISYDTGATRIVILLTDAYPSSDTPSSLGDSYTNSHGTSGVSWDSFDERPLKEDIGTGYTLYAIVSSNDRTVDYASTYYNPSGEATTILYTGTVYANEPAYDAIASYTGGAIYEIDTADYNTIFSSITDSIMADRDTDGDGIDIDDDACSTEDASSCDIDSDGCLDDEDGDGVSDCVDECLGSDASDYDTDSNGCIDDTDDDGILDDADTDIDADGIEERDLDEDWSSTTDGAEGTAECFQRDENRFKDGTNSLMMTGDCAIVSDYVPIERNKLYTLEAYFSIEEYGQYEGEDDDKYQDVSIGAYFVKYNEDRNTWEYVEATDAQTYFVADNLTVTPTDYEQSDDFSTDTSDQDLYSKWLKVSGNIGIGSDVEIPEDAEFVRIYLEAKNHGDVLSPWFDKNVWFDSVSFKENDKYFMIDSTVDGTDEREATDEVHTCIDQDTEEEAVTSDGGCVAFRDALKDSQYYVQFVTDGTCNSCSITPNSDSCRGVIDACDTNAILKVQKDRVCDEWVACETAEIIEDSSGSSKYTCFSLQPCNKINDEGKCISWVPKPVYEDLDTQTDITYYTAAGDTDQLYAMQNLTGYVKAGLTWSDYKMCNGGINAGNYCTSNDDCLDVGTCESEVIDLPDEDGGLGMDIIQFVCLGGSKNGEDCASSSAFGLSGDDSLCEGDWDGACNLPLIVEGYYPYGWMYEAGEAGSEYGVELIEYNNFENLYCAGNKIKNRIPCISNSYESEIGSHCWSANLEVYQSDEDPNNDPVEGTSGEDNKSADYYCANSTEWSEFPFSQPAEYTETGWSGYIGNEKVQVKQYDNQYGDNESIDINNVLKASGAMTSAGENIGLKYDLSTNIQNNGYYALSFKGLYTSNYYNANSDKPSSISVGLRHNNIVTDGTDTETQNIDWFIQGAGMADVVFVIDSSSSMSGYMAGVKTAATDLASQLQAVGIGAKFAIVDMDYLSSSLSGPYERGQEYNNVNTLDLDLTDNLSTFGNYIDTYIQAAQAQVDPFAAVQQVINNDLTLVDPLGPLDSSEISYRDASEKIIIVVTDTYDEYVEYDSRDTSSYAGAYDLENNIPYDGYYADFLNSSGFTVYTITTPTMYNYGDYNDLASYSGGAVYDTLSTTTANWTATILDISDRIIANADVFQFSQSLDSFAFGPIKVVEKNPCTDSDCDPVENVASGELVTSDLIFVSNDGMSFEIDDVFLLPVLEVNKNLNPISRSCRAYAKDGDKECVYTEPNGVQHKGWRGYCLEADPENSSRCITWWPLDVIAGESTMYTRERGGYSGRSNVYMCLAAKGYERPGFCSGTDVEGNDYDNLAPGDGVLCQPGSWDDTMGRSNTCGAGGLSRCFYGAEDVISEEYSRDGGFVCDVLLAAMIFECGESYLITGGLTISANPLCTAAITAYSLECLAGSGGDNIDNTYTEKFIHDPGICQVQDDDDLQTDCGAYPSENTWVCSTDTITNQDECEESGATWSLANINVFDSNITYTGKCIYYNNYEDYGDDQDLSATHTYCFYDGNEDGITEIRSTFDCNSDSVCQISPTVTGKQCAPMQCVGTNSTPCSPASCDDRYGALVLKGLQAVANTLDPSGYTAQVLPGLLTHNCEPEEACGQPTTLHNNTNNYGLVTRSWQMYDPYHINLSEKNYGVISKLEANVAEKNINISEIESIDIFLGDAGKGSGGDEEALFWGQGGSDSDGPFKDDNGTITITDLAAGSIPEEGADGSSDGPWSHCMGVDQGSIEGAGCWWWGQYDSRGKADKVGVYTSDGNPINDDSTYDLVYVWGWSDFMKHDSGCNGTGTDPDQPDEYFQTMNSDGNNKYFLDSKCMDNAIAYVMNGGKGGTTSSGNNPWNYVGGALEDLSEDGNDAVGFERPGGWEGFGNEDGSNTHHGGAIYSIWLDFDGDGFLKDIYTMVYDGADGIDDSIYGVEITRDAMISMKYNLRETCALVAPVVSPSGDNYAWANRASCLGATNYDNVGFYCDDTTEPWGSIAPMDGSINASWDSIDEYDDTTTNPYKMTAYGQQPFFFYDSKDKGVVTAGKPYSCIGQCENSYCQGDKSYNGEPCDSANDCGDGFCVGAGTDINDNISGIGLYPESASGDDYNTYHFTSYADQLDYVADNAQNKLNKLFADTMGPAYYVDYAPLDEIYGIYHQDADNAFWDKQSFIDMPECVGDRDTSTISASALDYCGVRPTISDIYLDGHSANTLTATGVSYYSIYKGQAVKLTFNSSADVEQIPVHKVMIDWGDGRVTNQTWDALPGEHVYTHAYGCGPEYANFMYSYKPGEACYYKGAITITDNWNWCSGATKTGTCSDNTYKFERTCRAASETWTEDDSDYRFFEEDGSDIMANCGSLDYFPMIIKVTEE
ncbi:MAG: hypothetical protein V1898_03595 [Patescibacteria group bacterium]